MKPIMDLSTIQKRLFAWGMSKAKDKKVEIVWGLTIPAKIVHSMFLKTVSFLQYLGGEKTSSLVPQSSLKL